VAPFPNGGPGLTPRFEHDKRLLIRMKVRGCSEPDWPAADDRHWQYVFPRQVSPPGKCPSPGKHPLPAGVWLERIRFSEYLKGMVYSP
jgi:hypothetical protein